VIGDVTALLHRALEDVAFSSEALRQAARLLGVHLSGGAQIDGGVLLDAVAAPSAIVSVPPIHSVDVDRLVAAGIARGDTVFRIAHNAGVAEAVVRARISALHRDMEASGAPGVSIGSTPGPAPLTPPPVPPPAAVNGVRLTPRQREVLQHLAGGAQYDAIAQSLRIQDRGVADHARNIRALFGPPIGLPAEM
jgi:hypothetical protein